MRPETYPLSAGCARISVEEGFLLVVEQGDPATAEEMTRYFAAIDRALQTANLTALLIVAQKTAAVPAGKPGVSVPPTALSPEWKAIREARWRALARSRAKRIAVIVDDELALARVQMAAVAARAPVRPFTDEADARAWLRESRAS
ncbi:MAG: STAS/SEC14 domain-containing protein [Myxococcales bacterium]|nr:STAS/SEC14 domain-containing protein [Myxococcales bacterium]